MQRILWRGNWGEGALLYKPKTSGGRNVRFLKRFNTGQLILPAWKWWLIDKMTPGHESRKLCGGGQEVLSLQHRALRHAGGLDRHSHHCHHNRQEMVIISNMISWFVLSVVGLVKLQRHLWAGDEDEAHKVGLDYDVEQDIVTILIIKQKQKQRHRRPTYDHQRGWHQV